MKIRYYIVTKWADHVIFYSRVLRYSSKRKIVYISFLNMCPCGLNIDITFIWYFGIFRSQLAKTNERECGKWFSRILIFWNSSSAVRWFISLNTCFVLFSFSLQSFSLQVENGSCFIPKKNLPVHTAQDSTERCTGRWRRKIRWTWTRRSTRRGPGRQAGNAGRSMGPRGTWTLEKCK
jgi:hypothetical protein